MDKNKYIMIFTLMCIFIICTPALAANTTVNNTVIQSPTKIIDLIGGGHNPPVVYMGEYVDLSKVVGWSGRIAFWYSGYPSSAQKPDIVIDASSFQHRFWIDPLKFKVGMWYKWDGEYEDSSNNEAFEVKSGTRPAAIPTEPVANFTGITPIVTAVPYEESNVHIVIARGDQLEYPFWYSDANFGYVWLFGKTQSILGDKMISPITDHTYIYPFSEEITQGMEVGWYTGYLQFCKKRPDVYYVEKENILDTPYDDAIIKDVDLDGLTPDRVKAEFEKLEKNTAYSEDKLINITVEVKDPIILFTDYYEEGDSIIIQGKSTLSAGTNISFIIDPDRYNAGYSTTSHTVWVTLKGDMDEPREFSVSIPVNWDEMAIGEHEVVAKADKLKIHLIQSKKFDITNIWVNPTPTLITEKVILESDGWHRVNTSIASGVTPTPEVIYVNSTPEIIYVYVTNPTTPTASGSTTTNPIAGVRTTTPPEDSPGSSIVVAAALVLVAAYIAIKKD